MNILTLLLILIVVFALLAIWWLLRFYKWAAKRYVWEMQVQKWLDAVTPCINDKCFPQAGGVIPPQPPPCKFGSC